MTDSNPFRAEIELILAEHQRTRFAKVLLGMNRGLTDAEIGAGGPSSRRVHLRRQHRRRSQDREPDA